MYAELSTKGYHACPTCGPNLHARYSKDLNKCVYPGYRRFLPMNHEMRRKDKRHYNSKVENAPPPHRMSPNDWYEEWSKVTMQDSDQRLDGMKGLSIFYELEYWKELKICHLLDPMHVFKNVAESLWRHITGQKDSLGARRDLQKCKIKQDLWPYEENGQTYIRPAPWILSKVEHERVKASIKKIRTPTGYGASLRNAFTTDGDLILRKTHDWHNFIQVCYTHFNMTQFITNVLLLAHC